jgi:hypothetical protein
MAPPISVNVSSAGMRCATGPPVSQKHVRRAAKAAMVRAGEPTQILTNRTRPVPTAARRPSVALTPARSKPIGRRSRCGPGARIVP